MPKFVRKRGLPIEANIFQWGMEAGVTRYNEIIPKEADKFSPEMRSTLFPGYLERYDRYLEDRGFGSGQWNPYVITIHGQETKVAEGDWIMPEPDGIHFYPCKPDIFEKTYEPAE